MEISGITGLPGKTSRSLIEAYENAVTSFKPFGVMTPMVEKGARTIKNKINPPSKPIPYQNTVMLPELVVTGRRPVKQNNTLKDKIMKRLEEVSPWNLRYYKGGGNLVPRRQGGGNLSRIVNKYGVKDKNNVGSSGILKYISDGFGPGSFFRPFHLGDIVVTGYPEEAVPIKETITNELGTFHFNGTEGRIPLRVEHPYGVEHSYSPSWQVINIPEQELRSKGVVPPNGIYPKALQYEWVNGSLFPGWWKSVSEIY